jgi:hypothetical protein
MKIRNEAYRVLCHCGNAFTDYQRAHIRKTVCRNLTAQYEDLGKAYCVFHYPGADKSNEFALAVSQKINQQDYLFYGTWFPDSVDFSGLEFTKWANFEWVTFSSDAKFDAAKFLENCQFIAASFKGKASFNKTLFSRSKRHDFPTNFYSTRFEGDVDFSLAEFKDKVTFEDSIFLAEDSSTSSFGGSAMPSFAFAKFHDDANFAKATFGNPNKPRYGSVSFSEATFQGLAGFQGVDFLLSAHFGGAIFRKTAEFRETFVSTSLGFQGASFEGFGKFSGKNKRHNSWSKGSLNFSAVDIEKSEKISFQTVELKPDYFINTDVRKFDFSDIRWKRKSFAFDWSRCKHIWFWRDDAKEAKSNYELLEVAYRRLAINAEESNHYAWASKFRYTASDIHRINRWYGRLPVTLLWWYKWTSRYGESWPWSAIVLAAILATSGWLYTRVDFYVCPPDRPVTQSSQQGLCETRALSFLEAGRHSLATASFQTVEHRKPSTDEGELIVLLEKIFAPIQAAFLALAIRRKVMR